MTALIILAAGILAAGAWCIVTRAGENEEICKYDYITEEENK